MWWLNSVAGLASGVLFGGAKALPMAVNGLIAAVETVTVAAV
jgi:hypothetical protein